MNEQKIILTPHDGCGMPVPDGALVLVRRGDGVFDAGIVGDWRKPLHKYVWECEFGPLSLDIVAYAVLKIEEPGE